MQTLTNQKLRTVSSWPHIGLNLYTFGLLAVKLRPSSDGTHVPNLTDELSTAEEQCLNQFGMAVLVLCNKSIKFDRVC